MKQGILKFYDVKQANKVQPVMSLKQLMDKHENNTLTDHEAKVLDAMINLKPCQRDRSKPRREIKL